MKDYIMKQRSIIFYRMKMLYNRKDTLDMYYPLRGIGTAYSFKLQYDSALVYYNKALEISCRANNNEMKAYVLY